VIRHVARVLQVAGIVVGIPGLMACSDVFAPPLPSDAEQFSPPAVYSTWWNMTQACSGITGSLGAVTWYKTDEPLSNPQTGDPIIGYWNSANNNIVLESGVMLDGEAVRHEMLHALVRKPGHPRNQFLGNCAGTVVCQGSCITDAGTYPPPPVSPIHVTGDSLDITLSIDPANPTTAVDGGFFTITVFVRNLSSHWATVMPTPPVTDTAHSFNFDVRNTGAGGGGLIGGEVVLDPSERIFAPGESKKQVFDFRIGDDAFEQQLIPGTYIARGGYSYYWSGDATLVLGP
jgi:hypothetical protein